MKVVEARDGEVFGSRRVSADRILELGGAL